jgi:hypothetical protein
MKRKYSNNAQSMILFSGLAMVTRDAMIGKIEEK